MARRLHGRFGDERLRIGRDWFGDDHRRRPGADHRARRARGGDGARRADAGSTAGTAEASEDATDARASGRRAPRRSAVPAGRRRCELRLLPGDARARRVSAGGADRRRRDRPGAPARAHAHDRPDLGDAGRRRIVRLRAPAARHRGRRRAARAVGVRFRAAEPAVSAAADAVAQVARFRRRGGREVRVDPPADPGPRVRAVHELRDDARRARMSARRPFPIRCCVQGTAPRSVLLDAVPGDAERGAAGDLVLLAGRGRRRASS